MVPSSKGRGVITFQKVCRVWFNLPLLQLPCELEPVQSFSTGEEGCRVEKQKFWARTHKPTLPNSN